MFHFHHTSPSPQIRWYNLFLRHYIQSLHHSYFLCRLKYSIGKTIHTLALGMDNPQPLYIQHYYMLHLNKFHSFHKILFVLPIQHISALHKTELGWYKFLIEIEK